MTGCDNGWEKWYGDGYNDLSPSEKLHVDGLKKKDISKRESDFQKELDEYEDNFE